MKKAKRVSTARVLAEFITVGAAMMLPLLLMVVLYYWR